MNIHPTAIIENGANIGEKVSIGAFAFVGKNVAIGSGTVIQHHASVDGYTILGENNVIFPYAFLGGQTQDLKYTGEQTGLEIGHHNIFREYVTIHGATKEGNITKIGHHNAFLAYAHVAHDCTVGDHVIVSSLAALAGHVILGNYVNIAWNSGVHQFCRIGDYAMLAASSKTVMDILPFMIAEGQPARTRYFNKINLQRHQFSAADVEHVKNIYRILFHSTKNHSEALVQLKCCKQTSAVYDTVIQAIESSQRGFC
ncbi:MAG: acyl-ACP--UDP-N-acetylglucosamine O-acyltransferase [Puniceicoccales bacterium]|jgi:UDP-N-acetylglucosamine acyltransferase|nr:acyl-ACP--UDP-N-acetylglucosamine O-acyltransferase [Puniceicoccales bacterium]